MEPVRIFSTRLVNFKIIAGWPALSTVFFAEGFCSLFNVSNEKFSKGGSMGEVLKFVTLDGGMRKKNAKKFLRFWQSWLILRPFLVTFRFERPVLSCAKRAQIKHKKNWRAQAKLLDVLSTDIMRKAKKWSYNLLAISDRLYAICRAANTKLFWHWLENIRNIMCSSNLQKCCYFRTSHCCLDIKKLELYLF